MALKVLARVAFGEGLSGAERMEVRDFYNVCLCRSRHRRTGGTFVFDTGTRTAEHRVS